MPLWDRLSINYIMAFSTVMFVIHISTTGKDIFFLASFKETGILKTCHNCSHLLLIQGLKFACLATILLNNIIFIVAIKKKKVYWKLLVSCMTVDMGLRLLRNVLNWLNIFVRLGNEQVLSSWMRIELHPLIVFGLSSFSAVLYMTQIIWFLGFGWKHKFIVGRDKIFGVKLKMLLYLKIVFVILHPILFMLNRTQLLLNTELRNKVVSKDPTIFITSAIILTASILDSFWYYWDVVCGIKQNSYKRTLRYFQWVLVLVPFFQRARLLLAIQEHDIFDHDFNRGFVNCLIGTVASFTVLAMHTFLFLYSMHLKQIENQGDENYKNVSLPRTSFNVDLIPRSRIKVENTTPIGSGNSSVVYFGTLQTSKTFWSRKEQRPVAIKALCGNNNLGVVKVIEEELRNMSRMMKQSKGHPHLVGFFGACFQDGGATLKPLGSVNIVMELCENGSLDKYLERIYEDLKIRGADLSHQCPIQLVSWAEQIAKGMEFLAKQNIIHGDLAARNILLNGTLTAKISDFGMSRKLYDYQIYVSKQQTVFPWRWMAPESLDGLKFSSASDVWSYGVLLWELFSFGVSPWPDQDWSSNFVSCLLAGERLSKPVLSSNSIYKIMLKCWQTQAEERPTFSDLLEKLASLKFQ